MTSLNLKGICTKQEYLKIKRIYELFDGQKIWLLENNKYVEPKVKNKDNKKSKGLKDYKWMSN